MNYIAVMRGTTIGAKRGRKPRGTIIAGVSSEPSRPSVTNSPAVPTPISTPAGATQYSRVQWAFPGGSGTEGAAIGSGVARMSTEGRTTAEGKDGSAPTQMTGSLPAPVIDPSLAGLVASSSVPGTPKQDGGVGLSFAGRVPLQPPSGPAARLGFVGVEEDVEVDDEVLPAMADDDYSAQLSWQSQSKDNLKCVYEAVISVPLCSNHLFSSEC